MRVMGLMYRLGHSITLRTNASIKERTYVVHATCRYTSAGYNVVRRGCTSTTSEAFVVFGACTPLFHVSKLTLGIRVETE